MSAATPETTPDTFRWAYWAIGGVLIVLAIVGLITYSGEKESERASQKAQELTQKYAAAGLTAPNEKIIVRTLGTDGGNICENPANALGLALLIDSVSNGASQVGRRPVIADATSFQGQKLIMETYCPDEVADFQEKVSEFKTDNTIKQ